MKKIFLSHSFIPILALVLFSGCVRYQSIEPASVSPAAITSIYTLPIPPGVYHQVESGQTLWSISKNYGVSISDVMKYNNLTKPQELVVKERIFIPSKGSRLPVEPLYARNNIRWKYIIIHHSATDIGNAETFQKGHLKRGFWGGLGYHFVIDNGSGGTKDGDIEVGRRWFYQMEGAHCQAGGMNKIGIGICLVGNFDQEYVTRKQLDSLVSLVDHLRRLYKIPLKNIKGHGFVSGANTHCPGKKFPWSQFRQELSKRASAY